jgi:GT2 family glycosyltransferase
VVERDFVLMLQNRVNTVRLYTVPPRWLLDLAHSKGLYVMVGIPWEQHVAFLTDEHRAHSIEGRVRAGMRACAGHPALLCFAVGNEIPAPIVRWHGRQRIERFLERLYLAAKSEDPEALVTYVNYPTTEYLQLPFLDFVGFNVYLEAEELLDAYLARLQNLAGERPLILTEIGMDSRQHGRDGQAIVLGWQLRTAFAAGCAGACVFAWTDEWHRGGQEVVDWDFGLVDRTRGPKPALGATRDAFADVPFHTDLDWPAVSVVVCTHNGAATLRDCLEGVAALDYPDFECIVVDDGSDDHTAAIAEEFDVELIRTPNEGLASARNRGLSRSTGDYVAYLDDDARPDPHWLRYLAATLLLTPHAAVGGPNLAPEDGGLIADCVARAPGGPTHVLISDREAEHVPGCNMAFRRQVLEKIDGFDPQFRVAGDDVDICWRLHERGWTIGFSPAAVVWHRRRSSLQAYLKQQAGYGKAEALLERKWPEKYNRGGHPSWAGRLYGGPYARPIGRRWRIYYGTWGSSLFQSLYERMPSTLVSLPLMPEWYLLIAALVVAACYEAIFGPMFFTLPDSPIQAAGGLLIIALLLPVLHAAASAHTVWKREGRLDRYAVTSSLFLLQPIARLIGRLRHGLTPWRRRGSRMSVPRPRSGTVWCENWRSLPERLAALETELRPKSTGVQPGGEFDRWDLQLRAGSLGAARLQLAAEEHGHGKQLLRYRIWPKPSRGGTILIAAAAVLAGAMVAVGRGASAIAFTVIALLLALRVLHECAAAQPPLVAAVEAQSVPPDSDAAAALLARASSTARLASLHPAASLFHGESNEASLTPVMENEE